MKGCAFMYELIKQLCNSKGISPTKLCIEITGSKGNLPTWQKGNINPTSLIKIADYFGVSTDYLLGRTDNPNGYSGNENSFNVGNGSTQTIGNYNTMSINQDINEDEYEVISILRSLPSRERTKLLNKIYDLDEEFKKKEM